MPRRRRKSKRVAELDFDEFCELFIGRSWAESSRQIPRDRVPRSFFPTPAERERRYWLNRDRLLEFSMNHGGGSRPDAWWEYESGLGGKPDGPEGVWLAAKGLLEAEEVAEILEADANLSGEGTSGEHLRPVADAIRARGASRRGVHHHGAHL